MSSTATPCLRAEEWISNEHSYYEIRTPMQTDPYRQFDEPIATGSSRLPGAVTSSSGQPDSSPSSGGGAHDAGCREQPGAATGQPYDAAAPVTLRGVPAHVAAGRRLFHEAARR